MDAKEAAAAEVAQYEKDINDLNLEYKLICSVHEPGTSVMCSAYHIAVATEAGQRNSAQAIVDDPPDRHFKTVAQPVSVHLKSIRAKRFSSFNALMRDIALVTSYEHAMATAANRATGAHDAHQQRYEVLQERAISRYARRILAIIPSMNRLIGPAGVPLGDPPKPFPTPKQPASFAPLVAADNALASAMNHIA